MNQKARLSAVVFDFDGVICQTELRRMRWLEAHLNALGLHVELRELYTLIGGGPEGKEVLMDRLFGSQPLYWKKREQVLARPPAILSYRELLTPGMAEILAALKHAGLKLAIASNSGTDKIEAALEQCGLSGAVNAIVSGWDLQRKKPDPYIYELALERLGVPGRECAAVEDSPVGIRAARAAGLFVAALKDPGGWIDQSESSVVLDTITQLPARLSEQFEFNNAL